MLGEIQGIGEVIDIVTFILKFIFWLMFGYGVTQIIVDATIFEPVREWTLKHSNFFGKMIHCRLCTSVWICAFLSILVWSPSLKLFIIEIVDINKLKTLELQTNIYTSDWDHFISIVAYKSYIYYCYIKSMIMDTMIGSSFIWFLYVIEMRLSK